MTQNARVGNIIFGDILLAAIFHVITILNKKNRFVISQSIFLNFSGVSRCWGTIYERIFNRPGAAGAVLQTPLCLID